MNATATTTNLLSSVLNDVVGVREMWWRWMASNFNDFALFSYVFYACLISGYIIVGGFFFLIDHFNVFPQYKIQKGRIPKDAEYWRCVVRLFFNYTVIIFPLSFFNYPAMTFLGVETSVDTIPSWGTFFMHMGIFLLMEDALHYIFHRILHIPVLYKAIHKVHHHHKYPFGLTASYASPIEILLLAIPTYSGPLLFAPHLSTVYIWILTREIDAMDTHSGYHFPFHPSNFVPFWGASKFHDYHHEVFNCNYASRFTYLDHIFGTYSQKEAKEDPKEKKRRLALAEGKAVKQKKEQ